MLDLNADFRKSVHCCAHFLFDIVESMPLNTTLLTNAMELELLFEKGKLGHCELGPFDKKLESRLGHVLVVDNSPVSEATGGFIDQADIS